MLCNKVHQTINAKPDYETWEVSSINVWPLRKITIWTQTHMYTYTHQCIFFHEYFSYHPSHHMRLCSEQLKAPESLLQAYFSETKDYFSRFVDSTDDCKTVVLPKDDNHKLVRPVLKFYRGEHLAGTLESNSGL